MALDASVFTSPLSVRFSYASLVERHVEEKPRSPAVAALDGRGRVHSVGATDATPVRSNASERDCSPQL